MSSEEIHPRGFWNGDITHRHYFDESLALALAAFFKNENISQVVDLGCGLGDYIKILLQHEIECEGYDGHPCTPDLSKGFAKVIDLSKTFLLQKKFEWVISLEVGEHIPKLYEKIFIENLDRHNTKGIILSWAIPGQGGFGHVNELDNDHVKAKLLQYNYTNDIEAEEKLRQQATLPWFKNTLMVFRKYAYHTPR